MSYDTKCWDLAAEFLEDEPGLLNEKNQGQLAQDIQDAIEIFIQEQRAKEGGTD